MKNLLTIIAAMLFFSFIASNAYAQPAPLPPGVRPVEYCYYVLLPYPHSHCEIRYYDYRRMLPLPQPHRRYAPGPRPRGPHPGSGTNHGPRPNHRPRR